MDNKTGLAVLSAVLKGMSCPNRILTSEEDNSTGIDVKDLHKILLKGCYFDPERENKTDTPTAENSVNIDVFVETMDGKPFLLTIKPTTTINELKRIILPSKEISPQTQRLILAIHLDDD
ncbi:hypothetical protein DAPPUDRAFT_302124 [Daphnia pulex]|uniref:Ubiquitin-like domain-containing protein n=1 Tax=Daphnia pulex TaxID=6669 RepID=E9GBL0_DAPPU|nr:hypothetical protein DAPPUDRAFT_302124 [Daphnia pulex]|eukprot:EFX82974.1 hypothetical protein DAPPUDRAFT_302124 [Daphnia pulex]